MQFGRATNTAALVLLLAAIVPAYAQRDRQDERQGRSERQRVKQQSPQQRGTPPAIQQQRAQRQQQGQRNQQARPPQRSRQQAAEWQQQRGWLRQGGWQGNTTWRQGRAQQWEREHRNWAQRGGYGGYYIPQDRFGFYFGSQHYFRIYSRPTMHMGYPRFSYGGYSFLLLDPWPEYWTDNWYATDDVYVDYDDGYYLYNRRRPGARLAITVVL